MSSDLVTLVTSVEILREARRAVKDRLFYLKRKEPSLTRDYQVYSNLKAQERLGKFLEAIQAQVGDVKYRS